MTALLISATVFEDRTMLSYSLWKQQQAWTPINICEATPEAWDYLTGYLYDAHGYDAVHMAVIDRRAGHSVNPWAH